MNLEDLHDASIDDPRFEVAQPEPEPHFGERTEEPAPFVADGTLQPLHENHVRASRIGGWIATANVAFVVPVGAMALIFIKGLPLWATLLVAFAACSILAASVFGAHFWPVYEYRYTRWRLDSDGLEIRRGVVWRHTISVPRERIQHTDVARGPIQRRFGLATLAVHTAGTHHSQIDLANISYETAQAIRNYLLEEADKASSEDAEASAAESTPEPSGQLAPELPPMTEASVESRTSFLVDEEDDGA